MKIEIGQVYTFNNGTTYDIINHIEKDDIWYQIWQIKDLSYYDKATQSMVVWSKALPNNEGNFMDIDFMSKGEFEALFKEKGKLLGKMNKDFGLNQKWNLVPKKQATRDWFAMTENIA